MIGKQAVKSNYAYVAHVTASLVRSKFSTTSRGRANADAGRSRRERRAERLPEPGLPTPSGSADCGRCLPGVDFLKALRASFDSHGVLRAASWTALLFSAAR